jgi:hypothetical protein
MPIVYSKSRFPVQVQKGTCRGCHGELPQHRRAWCSNNCYERFEPSRVRWSLFKRDKGICSCCGIDSEREQKRFGGYAPEPLNYYRYFRNGILDKERFERAKKIYDKWTAKRIAAFKNRQKRMTETGWPNRHRDWWEMDHIVPFSEGGLTVLENVRTLCVVCHKKRTKKWHKDRKKQEQTVITIEQL